MKLLKKRSTYLYKKSKKSIWDIILFSKNAEYAKKGMKGETKTTNKLRKLDKNYFVINDVRFSKADGNIDHIVLGINGIFVIETKNYEGIVGCKADEWFKIYRKDGFFGEMVRTYPIESISLQAKKNAIRTKEFIESCNILKERKLWVEPIVVFTNPNVELELENPSITVLKASKLAEYISSKDMFYKKELERIGNAIVKQCK